MNTDRELMQQALEVLERCPALYRAPEAATALRSALSDSVEQPQQERDQAARNGWVLREVLFDNGEPVGHREPQQEPVVNAKAIAECLGVLRPLVKGKWPHEQALEELAGYTSPPIEATPLASQRSVKPWVGLTTEDKVEILRANGEAAVLILTEAKLREKNA